MRSEGASTVMLVSEPATLKETGRLIGSEEVTEMLWAEVLKAALDTVRRYGFKGRLKNWNCPAASDVVDRE